MIIVVVVVVVVVVIIIMIIIIIPWVKVAATGFISGADLPRQFYVLWLWDHIRSLNLSQYADTDPTSLTLNS